MSRVWRYVALGAGAYLLILIATFPASHVTDRLQAQDTDLLINGVSGSVFSGHAAQAVYQDLDLGPVQWRFSPLSLLLGRIQYHLTLTGADNTGQLDAGKTLTGRSYIKNLDMVLLPDRLANHYSPIAVDTSGSMRLVFDELNPGDDYSGEVTGVLQWQDAAILEPVNLVLGSLDIDVITRDGLLVGRLENSGNLGATGELTLSPLNEYRVNLTLQPVDAINTETLDLLEQYAIRQPGGEYRIDLSGQL